MVQVQTNDYNLGNFTENLDGITWGDVYYLEFVWANKSKSNNQLINRNNEIGVLFKLNTIKFFCREALSIRKFFDVFIEV